MIDTHDLLDSDKYTDRRGDKEPAHHPKDETKIMALFFADAVNFSKLRDEDFPLFTREFWGLAQDILNNGDFNPVMENTWGDALYLVFPKLENAGLFALKLTQMIKETDWQAKGFPAQLNLRVALHAGPVFATDNPVTQRLDYVGASVCRAARIEPVTPPGYVFATREFAAFAAAENVHSFSCTYVGQMPMAKNFGTFPTYRVHK